MIGFGYGLNAAQSHAARSGSGQSPKATIRFGARTLAGAGGVAVTEPDGSYGPFTVAGGIATPNVSPLPPGNATIGSTPVVVIDEEYSVATQNEAIAALAAAHPAGGATVRLRSGLIPFDKNTNTTQGQSYVTPVVLTGEGGTRVTGTMTFNDTEALTLQGLWIDASASDGACVSLVGEFHNFEISDNELHARLLDPLGDYADGSYDNRAAIIHNGGGSSQTFSGVIARNYIHDVRLGIKLVCQSNDGFSIVDNEICRTYSDCVQVTVVGAALDAPKTVSRNVMYDPVGLATDTGNPHVDMVQILSNGANNGQAQTNWVIEQNVMFETPRARGNAQGICAFVDNSNVTIIKDAVVRGNLVALTSGYRIVFAHVDGGVYDNNTLVHPDDAPGTGFTTSDLQLGYYQSRGQIAVRDNVAERFTLDGTATYVDTGNVTLGRLGASIPYATQFTGSTFGPTSFTAVKSDFASASGPAGAIGTGVASYGMARQPSGWSIDPVTPPPPPANAPVTAVLMGQSELEYLLRSGSFYRNIPNPTPGDGNLIVFSQETNGAPVVKTIVNQASVDAGQVNPAMAALSAFLDHNAPGQAFVIGDCAVPGTSRLQLMDDSNAGRSFADFRAVVDAIEAEYGPVQHVLECWYNADASRITNFRNNFWPMYFGVNGDGSPFTLGSNGIHGSAVNHCLWDAQAAADAKGRGLFTRNGTKWHMLTPMPFHDVPVAPASELGSFSQNNGRLSEPARQSLIDLEGNTLAQSVGLQVGPSAHIADFKNAFDEIHPDVGNPDGQILSMAPIAVAMLRAAGTTIGEPVISGIEGPDNGAYVDLVVDLPNGGTLTTLRALRGGAYSGTSPHRQTVTGVEITRSGGARRPVFNLSEAGYPQSHRGTVTITDPGSGNPRKGRVRVTPSMPFANGDELSYLRGQATAALLEPRDFHLYPDFLIEHVPGLHDPSASYPFEGIAVRPYQASLAAPVAAPAFTARGANFDGSAYYAGTGLNIPAGSQGLISCWLRQAPGSWRTNRRIFEFRQGSTPVFEMFSTNGNQMRIRINSDTGPDTPTFRIGPDSGGDLFQTDQWYHVLFSWNSGGSFTAYVNDTFSKSKNIGNLDFAGNSFARMAIGAINTGAAQWIGDIAHLWVSTNQTLDISQQANREKFALAGSPVDLGPNGELPTGIAPEFYYDGDAPAWGNQGTGPDVALTGALTASGVPGY